MKIETRVPTGPKLNILSATDVCNVAENVMTDAADVIVKTLGPYGQYTIIQQIDGLIKTKDGKRVFGQLNYRNNLLYNSMLAHMETIATSVALKVGDGTSTATDAARHMYTFIKNAIESFPGITSRELEDVIHKVVTDICNVIMENSTKVSQETIRQDMKRIALVSTNWNEPLSEMLADIYDKTNNPIIKVENSGTEYTTVNILENTYTLQGSVLDTTHLTSRETGEGVYFEPLILSFDHNITEDYVQMFVNLAVGLQNKQVENATTELPYIIVLSPSFSDSFLNTLKSTFNVYNKNGVNCPKIVPIKMVAGTNFDKMCIRDAMMLTSASVISFGDELKEILKSVKEISLLRYRYQQDKSSKTDEATLAELDAQLIGLCKAEVEYFLPLAGICDELIVDSKNIIFKGFSAVDSNVYENTIADCKAGIDSKLNNKDALAMISEDVRLRKIRLGKLLCKSGTIKVGGYGKAEVEAIKDALDDAIKACEAVYHNGYNLGCSITVPMACDTLIKEVNDTDKSLRLEILKAIRMTFKSVFKDIVNNKRKFEDDEFNKIFTTCTTEKTTFDLVTETYGKETGKEIINPATTDTEVLKAAMRLTLLCLTSNQMITKDFGIADEMEG